MRGLLDDEECRQRRAGTTCTILNSIPESGLRWHWRGVREESRCTKHPIYVAPLFQRASIVQRIIRACIG